MPATSDKLKQLTKEQKTALNELAEFFDEICYALSKKHPEWSDQKLKDKALRELFLIGTRKQEVTTDEH